MTDTVNLGLPCIDAAQAQKHVTHNEALHLLDTLVQLAVLDRDLTAPPGSPSEGQRWIVKAGATGAWAGKDNEIAAWQDGGWQFSTPKMGWVGYVVDEGALVAWNGSVWVDALSMVTSLQNMTLLGVGTTADSTNPFSAKLNNALWTAKTVAEGGTGDLRYKMSKATATNTLSVLLQDNFSGRAEIGLTGDDDFHFKVSPDGSTWAEALTISSTTGGIRFLAAESDVASAATCDIGSAASLKIQITGTTTITSFGTVHHCLRFLRFAGALTLTHNATSLILPTGANIVTAAGDCAIATSDTSGNWRVRQYQRADGTPLAGGGGGAVSSVAGRTGAVTLAVADVSGAAPAASPTITGTETVAGTVDDQQVVKWSGDISPTQITADQNNYNPTGWSTATIMRLTTDATRSITGLAGGANGRLAIIFNVGTHALLITSSDTGSTAANRFLLPKDFHFTLQPNTAAFFRYDGTDSRWRSLANTAILNAIGVDEFNQLYPLIDATFPLGSGSFRFTNLFLSGAANIGTVVNEVHGADIASAGTVNLETATGNVVDVTGTTTITAITLSDGHERTVRFTGALTLTNGSSLLLPGGANITTAAGDYAVFRGYAAGVVRCSLYTKKDGAALVGSGGGVSSFNTRTGVVVGAAGDIPVASNNIVLNGTMDVSQELGTTGATLTNNTAKYILDCWEAYYNHGAATAIVTSTQLAAASFGAVLPGFSFGHQIKATTAITSPASGDFARHRSKIEGYRIAHLGWGASGAIGISLAFELYSTGSGTAFVKLSNSDQSRCYYHEITVASGWNFYSFIVPGDTSGTWQATTSAGLVFEVFVSGKETTPASSLDAWGSTNKVQTTNSTNLLGTNNNLTVLTGVFISAGSQVLVSTDLPAVMSGFVEELKRAERYWQSTYDYGTAPGTATHDGLQIAGASATFGSFMVWRTPMKAAPTMSTWDGAGAANKCSQLSTAGTWSDGAAAATIMQISTKGVAFYQATNTNVGFHYVANVRL